MSNAEQILEISKPLEQELGFSCAAFTEESWRTALAERINELIIHDFDRLIRLLYRLDISETSLRQQLPGTQHDAGMIIADMIVERQIQKLQSRQEFRGQDKNTDESERW